MHLCLIDANGFLILFPLPFLCCVLRFTLQIGDHQQRQHAFEHLYGNKRVRGAYIRNVREESQ